MAKLAVVTGSASGIGRGIAAALAADDLDVVGWDLAGEPAVDVGDDASVAAAMERLEHPVDVAVLAAGVSSMAPLLETTTADWERQFRVNAFGAFNCIRALAPRMPDGGSIVVIASVAALRGAPLLSAYCASKFALIGLVESAAAELGELGIRINAVCPMYVRTPMQDREVVWEGAARGLDPEAVRDSYVRATPLGRMGEVDDIADVVRFLVGPLSRFMSGSAVTVSGGAHLGVSKDEEEDR